MKTLWTLNELAPYVFNPKQLSGELDVKESMKDKSPLIEDVKTVRFDGEILKDSEQELYILSGKAEAQLVLKSTRSLAPVEQTVTSVITESYVAPGYVDTLDIVDDDDLYFVADDNVIDIGESVVENIILSIPTRVLTEEEKQSGVMPEGEDWKVLSEEAFVAEKKREKQENSPFSALYSLFNEDDE